MDWSLHAWLNRGSRRKSILNELKKSAKPMTTKDISNNLNIAISQASFTLKELTGKKMTECLNPRDKIGKLYRITKEGREISNGI